MKSARLGVFIVLMIVSSACSSNPNNVTLPAYPGATELRTEVFPAGAPDGVTLRSSFRTQDEWGAIQAFYRDKLQQQGWEQSDGTLLLMDGEKQAFQYVMRGCPSRYISIGRNAQETDIIEIIVFEKPCV